MACRSVLDFTYAQLDAVLRALGFSASVYERDTRVYKHAPSGALVTFPIRPGTDSVLPHHLAGTRMILDAFGVALPPELAIQLQAG